jgi:hypothetical protein
VTSEPLDRRDADPTSRGGRLLRGVSGIVAGGLAALAVVLFVGWVVTARSGTAGPGTGMLLGHGIAAVVALAGQSVADRRRDRTGLLAAVGVLAVGVAVLCGFWLF